MRESRFDIRELCAPGEDVCGELRDGGRMTRTIFKVFLCFVV